MKSRESGVMKELELLSVAQAASTIGNWEWNVTTGELFRSKQTESLFGYEEGEFGNTFGAFPERIHPDDRQSVLDAIEAGIEGERDYEIEHRVVWPNGTVRWVLKKGTW